MALKIFNTMHCRSTIPMDTHLHCYLRSNVRQRTRSLFTPLHHQVTVVGRNTGLWIRRANPSDKEQESRSTGKRPPKQMLVYVPPHPLVQHWVGIMRSAETPTPIFRSAATELGRILLYELLREWMPTMEAQVQTPTGHVADATFVDPTQPLVFVPVLRAGLVLLEQTNTLVPSSKTYHVGYVRDEETLQSSCYVNKLPSQLDPSQKYIVSDMMLATGGTMIQVIQDMIDRGADPANIRIISALAAPPALKKLNDAFPGLVVYTGIIDPEVNDQGYIIPGVGDAGDRAFGTL